MLPEDLRKHLRFYFITDDSGGPAPLEQAKAAILGGATMVQYRNKAFDGRFFEEATAILRLCRVNQIPFIVNDDPVLARALGADGVHVGQADGSLKTARSIVGKNALVGVSVSTLDELARTPVEFCDYIGTGPVFATSTKPDASPVIGVAGLKAVIDRSKKPVVAIGGINAANAAACFSAGAAGVAVISCVSRADSPLEDARFLAGACGIEVFSEKLNVPWNDEFGLIDRLLAGDKKANAAEEEILKVGPGDDAAVLHALKTPVITTDAQVENVHFSFSWQRPGEVGQRAVTVVLSDLAAAYARPVSLFVNLTLPHDRPESLAIDLYAGLKKGLAVYDCALGGGNLSGGREVSLNLFAVGEARAPFYPARANARPGDDLYCTGPLGRSRAGLLALAAGLEGYDSLVEAFKFPRARFDAAIVLADYNVRCVMDISDGLAGDARHIARASGITLCFDVDTAVCSDDLQRFCEKTGNRPEEMIFSGGEDYELLFACPPETARRIGDVMPVYRLGRCLSFDGEYLRNLPEGVAPFQHGHAGSGD
ncbi:thiamine-phosphate kinase [Desulfosudis oleivorans]|uniref:Multifunctional fusion protein n=1 Tax=Desulfosudis oleivorans (strain DSM 6200 / JCM 39069 / Hxd3) TaxID=96561 RepID=A9A0U4_DESOH|nr:thiamine-phosphate kinase [Desulfosudis oleivorans]ABW67569.1 thiamine-phosphate pyrophosphorylase [Desulfosudis oleivorans Hxd3]